ncbi:DNA mismatch repair protein msh6 [Ceratocystis fimbriata CBS 114723]|uniref:DNA mismatch repair protein n=1 Tax=Ceratocystis fimbriata CBS 114723 TaxID=1035309 RepID=A0A2C5X4E4_9PEZI|nr:DNA mismatch repair protein msh6 [Ceratocystis fimbriata CBS 114723]
MSSTVKTPAKTPSKVPTSSAKNVGSATGGKQSNIMSFFGKKSAASTPSGTSVTAKNFVEASPTPAQRSKAASTLKESTDRSNVLPHLPRNGRQVAMESSPLRRIETAGGGETPIRRKPNTSFMSSSPTRKTKKAINYAESSDDDDEDPFERIQKSTGRRSSSRRVVDDDDEEFDEDAAMNIEDDEMDDFIVDDSDSDVPSRSLAKKRKRAQSKSTVPKRPKRDLSPMREEPEGDGVDSKMENLDLDQVPGSSCMKWNFDPNNFGDTPVSQPPAKKAGARGKEKAYKSEPEDRYPWLAQILDMNRKPPGHPEYDPSTIFVPPGAWNKFSPFEKQYWEIKQKLWDTVVFFKKGKFYELYENDATIGHQMFDLKLTDRVNMRMVGVPEASLVTWVNQFVAKGYKVARVDQMESALGKEMRERGTDTPKNKKADKIIRRELHSVLTAGTLVDGNMLQDDMATYCVAIKETMVDDVPVFGLAFVDAATGSFHIAEFEDDVDLTKFETFVAQVNPRELVLEKGHVSTKALRILKNNTAPSTLWNYKKSGTDFWDADTTRRELKCGGYFTGGEDGQDEIEWPKTLEKHKGKDNLMSALGGLIQYLRTLKMESSLISQGNFSWYSPIQKNGTLILDGQTLINLEVFSNTSTGGVEGTLFSLLNHCVTPFGKRMFRQWVCHPLCNIDRINERLDAVQMLNTERSIRDQFTSQMTKLPDLERLISRIHAGACRPEDFVKVLDGFAQIEYAFSLFDLTKVGQGLFHKLVTSMPNLAEPLDYWKTAIDMRKARDEKKLIPEPGIEEEFDESVVRIAEIKKSLNTLLDEKKTQLKSRALKYTDVGKEIYQMEVPKSIKVPGTWQQMSSTNAVKRYYFSDLTKLVRELQEAEEMHSQIIKKATKRLFQRFDADNETWLLAIRIVAQMDCLVSLAKSSASLGSPSCRPVFVDEERSVVEFSELRHPCMSTLVDDFIPNDISLGGENANISLLTGANAAGKSTVLRMSCTAVIMAQIGCFVPAVSARLTPVDRIMSRLGANDNIFAAQSTFFVELSETKKILAEATPRSLVILDELGRGTSSYDGVAVAQAVLHHVASHVGCIGFFATHYHSLATEFEHHPEIRAKRMQIQVDEGARRVTFLYKLEDGVAEGSFGMHCAAMCGIPDKVIGRAEVAAREWEHTSRLKESLDKAKTGCYIPLGLLSDVGSLLRDNGEVGKRGLETLLKAIESL